ncbi:MULTISPECIES: DinB family protein [Neobacillus]|uniref:DinB family protein n=1 Tax=Neobacillus rhizophilus TaxID=2833579 RepID=A0A942U4P5_9BACI|nr:MULTISPECIES: DinB family protein [Neobacillus]MBS4210999.1 DinB family protein [Neobacillus rhizophilus]MBU8917451.1 DinB family protein [Bacillus sp. FJAT-29953]
MYTSIQEFVQEWNQEAGSTQKIMDALTDGSLQQMVSTDDRSLGRIGWHIVTSTPGMLKEFGINVALVENEGTVPTSAKTIADAFRKVSADTVEAVQQQWTDDSLTEMKDVFGMKMPKAVTLNLLIKHVIHHRGQMTVLMRQAGLQVPGVYGPAREEWSQMGMEAPAI